MQRWRPASCHCIIIEDPSIIIKNSASGIPIFKYINIENKCKLHSNLTGQALLNAITEHEHSIMFSNGRLKGITLTKLISDTMISDLEAEKNRIKNL